MNYLITAVGSFAAEAVISTLRSTTGSRVIGCNCHPAEWTANSKLVDKFHQVPHASDPDEFLNAILEICRSECIERIIPLTDPEIDVLAAKQETLSANGATLCLPAAETVRQCRDKWRVFETFAYDTNVTPIPTCRLDDTDDRYPSQYPLIAKPRFGRSSEGIFFISDQAEYEQTKRKLKGSQYIVQPKLEGEVYVVDIVRQTSSGVCATLARRELLRTPNGAGLTVEMLCRSDLNNVAIHVANRLDVNGCINMEFLLHRGKPMLMDINPRFSAGVAFSIRAGYDMVTNHLRCFDGIPIDPQINPAEVIYARRYVETTMTPSGE